MYFEINFDWVVTHQHRMIVEADSQESAIAKLDNELRNRNAPDYEDPNLWLPDDKDPVLRVNAINGIDLRESTQ